jgi:hypothetical protein
LSSFRSSKPFFKDLIVDKLPFSLWCMHRWRHWCVRCHLQVVCEQFASAEDK